MELPLKYSWYLDSRCEWKLHRVVWFHGVQQNMWRWPKTPRPKMYQSFASTWRKQLRGPGARCRIRWLQWRCPLSRYNVIAVFQIIRKLTFGCSFLINDQLFVQWCWSEVAIMNIIIAYSMGKVKELWTELNHEIEKGNQVVVVFYKNEANKRQRYVITRITWPRVKWLHMTTNERTRKMFNIL